MLIPNHAYHWILSKLLSKRATCQNPRLTNQFHYSELKNSTKISYYAKYLQLLGWGWICIGLSIKLQRTPPSSSKLFLQQSFSCRSAKQITLHRHLSTGITVQAVREEALRLKHVTWIGKKVHWRLFAHLLLFQSNNRDQEVYAIPWQSEASRTSCWWSATVNKRQIFHLY